MPVILLHGLGQGPSSWDAAAAALDREVLCPALLAPVPGQPFTYPQLYRAFAGYCGGLEGPLHLCGLSLGGIFALQYAAERPDRVGSLVLIAAQYVMPKRLLAFQNLAFRLLPGGAFRGMGLTKGEVLGLTRSMIDLDFREDLGRIACPTLVLCGRRDRANRKAALGLHQGIPGSGLAWVPGAGHEVNAQAPEALAAILTEFWGPAGPGGSAPSGDFL